MSKRSRFPELKAELCQRQAHAREVGKRIRATSGEERMQLWEQKREYGRKTRALLLLYALLRGKTRESCEPRIGVNDEYYLSLTMFIEHKRLHGVELATKSLNEWLSPPTPPMPAGSDAEALPGSPS